MFKLTLSDRATFDKMLAKAQALATGRVSRALMPRIAANEVRRLATDAKSSATGPNGKAWKKTKDGRPLRWPSQARITVTIVGGKVVARVTGPDYLAAQHSGWRRMVLVMPRARGGGRASGPARMRRWRGPPRRILPKKSIPKQWADPIVKALNAGWRTFMVSTSLKRAK